MLGRIDLGRNVSSTSTLRTSALATVCSTAEYAAASWCRSVHVRKIDAVQNHTMRIITGCVRVTPTDYLPVLSGIALTKNTDGLPLNKLVMEAQFLGPKSLKPRHPIPRHAAESLRCNLNLSKAWNSSWEKTLKAEQLTFSPSTKPFPGAELTRSTRNSSKYQQYFIPQFATNLLHRHIKFGNSTIWNSIPDKLKQQNHKQFKNKYKKLLLTL